MAGRWRWLWRTRSRGRMRGGPGAWCSVAIGSIAFWRRCGRRVRTKGGRFWSRGTKKTRPRKVARLTLRWWGNRYSKIVDRKGRKGGRKGREENLKPQRAQRTAAE